jgi:hypothetical protein
MDESQTPLGVLSDLGEQSDSSRCRPVYGPEKIAVVDGVCLCDHLCDLVALGHGATQSGLGRNHNTGLEIAGWDAATLLRRTRLIHLCLVAFERANKDQWTSDSTRQRPRPIGAHHHGIPC